MERKSLDIDSDSLEKQDNPYPWGISSISGPHLESAVDPVVLFSSQKQRDPDTVGNTYANSSKSLDLKSHAGNEQQGNKVSSDWDTPVSSVESKVKESITKVEGSGSQKSTVDKEKKISEVTTSADVDKKCKYKESQSYQSYKTSVKGEQCVSLSLFTASSITEKKVAREEKKTDELGEKRPNREEEERKKEEGKKKEKMENREETKQSKAEAEKKKGENKMKEEEKLKEEKEQEETKKKEEQLKAVKREEERKRMEEAMRRKKKEEEAERRKKEEEAVKRKEEARRKEEEVARRKKAEEEAASKKKAEEEAARRKKEEEEAARRKKEEEEAARRKKEEEEAARRKKEEEEAARRKKEEEEAARRKKEEEEAARRKKEEEEAARRKKEEEEAARRKKEEEEAARKKEEEAVRRKKEEEEAVRRKKEEEEAVRRKKAEEEAARRKKAEEEAARRKKAEEEAARRKKAEEEAARRKKAEEEAARRKKEEEEAARRKKEEEEAARKKKEEEEAARRKKEEEEAARRKKEEEATKIKEEAVKRKKEEEEVARQKKEEELARKKKVEEEAARRKEEVEMRRKEAVATKKKEEEKAVAEKAETTVKDEEETKKRNDKDLVVEKEREAGKKETDSILKWKGESGREEEPLKLHIGEAQSVKGEVPVGVECKRGANEEKLTSTRDDSTHSKTIDVPESSDPKGEILSSTPPIIDYVTLEDAPRMERPQQGSNSMEEDNLDPKFTEAQLMSSGNEKKEHLYKILVIGELGTGKTSIIKRYVHQFFSQHYRATIGVDFALKVISWDADTLIRLQLWDIAGQERFGNMTRVYYKEAVGAFVVFDVTRVPTFEAVVKWKNDLDSKVQLSDGSHIPCVLLANKCDQTKEGLVNNSEQMEDFCKEKGFLGWFETSAKENINIDEAARFLVSQIHLRLKNLQILKNDQSMNSGEEGDKDKIMLDRDNHQEASPKKSCCR